MALTITDPIIWTLNGDSMIASNSFQMHVSGCDGIVNFSDSRIPSTSY